MPRFPDSATWPIDVIDFEPENEGVDRPTVEHWIDALTPGVLPRTDEPGVLPGDTTERHGWGGYGSKNEIVRLGDVLFLTRRSFVRRVPPSTLRAHIEKQVEAWCHDAGVTRAPKAIRQQIKAEVTEALTRRAIPTIRDVAVIVDVGDQRAYVLARSGSGKRTGIATSLRQAAQQVYAEVGGGRAASVHRTLGERLLEQFGDQRLPGGLDQDFMRDLIGHGRDAQTLVIGAGGCRELGHVVDLEGKAARGEAQVLRVELGDRIQASAGKEAISARGEHETERIADNRVLGDDEVEEEAAQRVQVRSVQISVWDALGRWDFVLAPDATIQRCVQPKLALRDVDSALGTMWLRSELTRRAVQLVDQLVHAYVVTRLGKLIAAQPQRPLFQAPDRTPTPCSWCASASMGTLEAVWKKADVSGLMRTSQIEMFVPAPGSVTKEVAGACSTTATIGGSVTVTADDAARALKLLGGDAGDDGDHGERAVASDESLAGEVEVEAVDEGDVESSDGGDEEANQRDAAKAASERAAAQRERLIAAGYDPTIVSAVVADELERGRFSGAKAPTKKPPANATTKGASAYTLALNVVRARAESGQTTTAEDLKRSTGSTITAARKVLAQITANGEMPDLAAGAPAEGDVVEK